MSQSQSLIEMDETPFLVSPELDYAEMVESYQKDHETTNLITQRIQIMNHIKETEEERLNSIKETCREVQTDNETIKNKVVEHSMLVSDWIKCASENSKIEANVKLLKQLLEVEEKNIYEDQIKRLEKLNQKYITLKTSLAPKILQDTLNTLCAQELLIDNQIAKAENTLIKLQKFNPDTHSELDLGPLNIICEELQRKKPRRDKRIESLQAQNKADQKYIKKLKTKIDQYDKDYD